MSERSRVFTYAEFNELAKKDDHPGSRINTAWRWAVLGIKKQPPLRPLEAKLTENQLNAALGAGRSHFPSMSDEQWAVFVGTAQKLLDS